MNNDELDLSERIYLARIIHRLKYGGGHKQQAIARAVGTSSKRSLVVIDATCGLGTDALILAHLNCKIFAIERNVEVAKLLSNRFKAAAKESFLMRAANNIQLFRGDCLEVIPRILVDYNIKPDVIYLDPMFANNSKAAPNKLIQIIRSLLSNEVFTREQPLLASILELPINKVVVKRGRTQEYLENIKPHHSLIGKSNRFDIYKVSSCC